MNKRELSQLYYLNREIEEQQRRLQELEALATSCTSHITGMPKAQGVVDRLAGYVAEIADLRSLIDLNIKKCFFELNRLNRYINGIEDSQMRLILSLRYINGLSWQQIAFSIGEYDEQYPRRKHNAFLRTQVDENDERKGVDW
ncbi:MAG: hypothetical protein PHI27_05655 [Eubacteriales bacterium]|nr:hypothetical protein [Eubacteriales bacterium]